MAAEFVAALSTEEQREILEILEPESCGRIFAHLDEEAKLALVCAVPTERAVELMRQLAEDDRVRLLEALSANQQARLREALADLKPAEAQPIRRRSRPHSNRSRRRSRPSSPPRRSPARSANISRSGASRQEGGALFSAREGVLGQHRRSDAREPPADRAALQDPRDFLTASLDIDETARVEVEDGATLFIVKVPYFDESNVDVLYFTIPVGIILAGDLVLTICTKPDSVLRDFTENRVRNIARGDRFILQIIMRATLLYLPGTSSSSTTPPASSRRSLSWNRATSSS